MSVKVVQPVLAKAAKRRRDVARGVSPWKRVLRDVEPRWGDRNSGNNFLIKHISLVKLNTVFPQQFQEFVLE